ncbi:MAG TPA: GNAT family N-acetyltransferase [Frankiaceae bacterium]|nr:GNAT family N-acetyltransferase [Frankiaceae bacterium]
MTSTSARLVRVARLDELPAVGLLTRTAYAAAGLGSDEYLAHVQDAASRFASATLLVAEVDGRLAGTVTLAAAGTPFADIARPGEYEFRMLAVDPASAGAGIGSALVAACEQQAQAAGADWIVCSVEDKNAPALRLYARLGYLREPDRDWVPEPGVSLLVLGLKLGGAR